MNASPMDVVKKKNRIELFSRRGIVSAAAVIVLAVAAFAIMGLDEAMPSASRSELWIDEVQRGDMVQEIRATGTLVPKQVRWLAAGGEGAVQEVLVQPGARVSADTVILRLNNPMALATLEKARAALAGADAAIAAKHTELDAQRLDQEAVLIKAQSQLKISTAKTDALRRALAAGVISKLELMQSEVGMAQDQSMVAIEKQRVSAARSNFVAQMQAERARRDELASALRLAEQSVAELQVRAGIDGILQQVSVEPGQQVAIGASLARVARQDELIARLLVPEVLAKDLVLDLPVRVDTRNGVAEGRIGRIDPAVREGRVTVDIDFPQPLPAGARPDLSVDGSIVLARLRDVVSVGRASSAMPGGASTLFVLRDGGEIAQRTRVVYGRTSSDRIEVKSGLRPGDRVVLSDTAQWSKYPALRVR
ncbi:HlyD family secretion protein [Lysobacter enzymogenes]|uniref:efflux RND transporter periplasmic adaptor subunit n=1 Tax=Lysobacter enzymogenes TaxID=69 RepID=UPI003392B010